MVSILVAVCDFFFRNSVYYTNITDKNTQNIYSISKFAHLVYRFM